MLPPPEPFFTVMMPSCTSHPAGDWSFTFTHSSSFFPLKRTIASEGGSVQVAPGVTTFGSGDQTSVSSGLGLGACSCEKTGTARETKVAKRRDRCSRVVIAALRIHRWTHRRRGTLRRRRRPRLLSPQCHVFLFVLGI